MLSSFSSMISGFRPKSPGVFPASPHSAGSAAPARAARAGDDERGAGEPVHLKYIDALRGVAAFQVLLCHLALAFAPSVFWATPRSGTLLGYVSATPLFFALDGASAVCVFFVISGYVLTPLFARSSATAGAHCVSRFLRLAIPALAACAISAILFALLSDYTQTAGRTSEWLGSAWRPSKDLSFVKDALVNGLLVGFREDSVAQWFGLAPGASPQSDSYLGVLWTLSIEFYGSFLVLALTRARSWTLTAVVALMFSRSYFLCFVAGHAAARRGLAERPPLFPAFYAACAALLGIMICMTSHYWTPGAVSAICAVSTRLLPPCPGMDLGYLLRIYGGTLFTLAVMQSAPARRFLLHKTTQTLGRLSFSLYLMHWPVIFGIGSFLLVALEGWADLLIARGIDIVLCGALALLAAAAFERIDQIAIRFSRAARSARVDLTGAGVKT